MRGLRPIKKLSRDIALHYRAPDAISVFRRSTAQRLRGLRPIKKLSRDIALHYRAARVCNQALFQQHAISSFDVNTSERYTNCEAHLGAFHASRTNVRQGNDKPLSQRATRRKGKGKLLPGTWYKIVYSCHRELAQQTICNCGQLVCVGGSVGGRFRQLRRGPYFMVLSKRETRIRS